MTQVFVDSLEQTRSFATKFAQLLDVRVVVFLEGELGAGKTTFVKELVAGLGSSSEVTSPTFGLVNRYEALFPIYHIDCYRLSDPAEAYELGVDELSDEGAVIIEWASNVSEAFGTPDIVMSIEVLAEHSRRFDIKILNHGQLGETIGDLQP